MSVIPLRPFQSLQRLFSDAGVVKNSALYRDALRAIREDLERGKTGFGPVHDIKQQARPVPPKDAA